MYSYCGMTQGHLAGAPTLQPADLPENSLLHNWTEYFGPKVQVNNNCKQD